MGQCKSKNAEMGSAGVAQVQKRVPEYNVEAHKNLLQFRQNSKLIRTQTSTVQNLSLKMQEKFRKNYVFFSDSLQETTIDTLGTGIELSQ